MKFYLWLYDDTNKAIDYWCIDKQKASKKIKHIIKRRIRKLKALDLPIEKYYFKLKIE